MDVQRFYGQPGGLIGPQNLVSYVNTASNLYHSPAGVMARGAVNRVYNKLAYPTPSRTPSKLSSRWTHKGAKRTLFTSGKVNKKRRLNSGGRTLGPSSRGGRFKKGKGLKKGAKGYRKGSVLKLERGGAFSDQQCCYIGHSTTAFNQILQSMARTLVKELFRQKGESFSSWDETYENNLATMSKIEYTFYERHLDPLVNTVNLLTGINPTYEEIATQIKSSLQATFNSFQKVIFVKFSLKNDLTPGSNIWTNVGTIEMKQFMIHFDIVSKLNIQNVTLAGTGTTGDQELATEIRNNPLRGKSYDGPGNGFIPKYRQAAPTFWSEGFVADGAAGILLKKATDVGLAEFQKPPNGSFFDRCNKTSFVNLIPGAIKSSSIRFKKSIAWNTFSQKYAEELLNVNSSNTRTYFGVCRMFAFEKQLDARGENPVKISYEFNLNMSVSYKYRPKTLVMAIIDSTTVAVVPASP